MRRAAQLSDSSDGREWGGGWGLPWVPLLRGLSDGSGGAGWEFEEEELAGVSLEALVQIEYQDQGE